MTEKQNEEGAAQAPDTARIVNPEGRSKSVPLAYPVEFDGKIWDSIEVRRCTGNEIAKYFEELSDRKQFVLPPVIQCPLAVWEALDADDQFEVDEVAQAFMPRRLKAAVELLSGTGENTSDK